MPTLVYKYLSPEGTLRFLQSWAFRITPPDQFNDPFEMRPMLSIDVSSLMEQAPLLARRRFVEVIVENYVPGGAASLTDADAAMVDVLVSYFLGELSEDAKRDFLLEVAARQPQADLRQLASDQSRFHQTYLEILANAEAQVPEFMRQAEYALHEVVPRHIGVLCLSGSSKHHLMWGHYADSHKGALIELNANAPCFNRRRHDEDEFGCLRRVGYSETRPTLDLDSSAEESFASLALTKPLEWAYEQELRLLWPLSLADDRVETDMGPIHLVKVPASAVLSITVGCRADKAFLIEVIRHVLSQKGQSSIALRRAVIDKKAFAFHYESIQ